LIKVGPAKGSGGKPVLHFLRPGAAGFIGESRDEYERRNSLARTVIRALRRSYPAFADRNDMTYIRQPDRRKCSADEYASTVYPCDFRNALTAEQTHRRRRRNN
jgi:hypothetical protein